ncbi:MAG: helix-turn-helix domain-containing protein [Bacteroidota bacterium]|nr:helix-turn-helix domain-containing protein [Bacteroidota bacterium]
MMNEKSNIESAKTLTRKERERLARRREIVEAARAVFASRGFAEATLEEIAERAEYGKGTLYGYFQNKEELFEAVISDSLDRLLELTHSCCSGSGESVVEKYQYFARTLLRYLFENQELFRLILREMHGSMRHPRASANRLPEIIPVLEQPLRVALSETRGIDTKRIAFLFLVMLLTLFQSALPSSSMASGCVEGQESFPVFGGTDEAIEHILRLLDLTFFHGIRVLIEGTAENPMHL